jgi:hypothetical protein
MELQLNREISGGAASSPRGQRRGMRRSVALGDVGTVRPLKARGFAEFGRCMVSTCPVPFDRWA